MNKNSIKIVLLLCFWLDFVMLRLLNTKIPSQIIKTKVSQRLINGSYLILIIVQSGFVIY